MSRSVELAKNGDQATSLSVQPRRGLLLPMGYRVGARIGTGSMGEVYRAEHIRLGKPAAVKFLRAELSCQPRCVARFRSEVRSLSAIRDPHVVDILDCGETSDRVPYFVMEYLVGQDLRRVLARSLLAPERVIAMAEDVCCGLAAVHAAGLVHRDIKPGNLFLTVGARHTDTYKILDFGVAKLGSTGGTLAGSLLGTMSYMAPEQLMDSASVGPLSDVYSLAAVMYEALVGRPPHQADSEQKLMFAILNREHAALCKLRPDLPAPLASLIDRALALDPSRRPSSAQEMRAELASLAHASSAYVPPVNGANSRQESTLADSSLVESKPSRSFEPRLSFLRSNKLALSTVLLSLPVSLGVSEFAGRSQRTVPIVASTRPLAASTRAPQPVSSSRRAQDKLATVIAAPPAAAASSALRRSRVLPRLESTHTLVPSPPAVPLENATGTLHLAARPVWAEVRLDGLAMGSTPLVLAGVATGRHLLEALPRGGEPAQRRVIQIRAGATQRVEFEFLPADTER